MRGGFRRKGPESPTPRPVAPSVDLSTDKSFQIPDHQEERDAFNKEHERLFGREFSRRHRSATAALALEQVIWESDDYDSHNLENLIDALDAPPQLKENLQDVAEDFARSERVLNRIESQICRLVGQYELNDDPERAGAAMYRGITEKEPDGRIHLSREAGCFVVKADSQADFAAIVSHGRKGDMGDLADYYGHFRPRTLMKFKGESIQHLQDTPNRSFLAPTIFINVKSISDREKEDAHVNAQNIVRHERIHNMYRHFGDDQDPYDRYKEELLARIREGASARTSTNFVKGGGYDSLKTDKQDPDFLKTKMKKIKGRLKKLYKIYETSEARGALTYHLFDIPFAELSKHLKQLTEQTEKLLSCLDPFEPPDPDHAFSKLVAEIQDDLEDFPEGVGPNEKELVRIYEAWEDAYDHAYEALLTQSPTLAQIAVNNLEVIAHHAKEAYS